MRRTHPIIDQRVTGARVEGEKPLRPSDPPHIRDAPDIEDRERLWQPGSKRSMKQRRQRSPLPARSNIGRPKVGDDIQPQQPRQQPAVADLPAAAIGRAMQDRVAMKADNVDRNSRMPTEKLLERLAMEPGQLALHFSHRPDTTENPNATARETPAGTQ